MLRAPLSHVPRSAVIAALLTACAASPGPPAAPASDSGAGRLLVRVEGLTAGGGSVALALFASPEAFGDAGPAVATARLSGEAESVEWQIVSLPFGEYAVKAYQDRNDNGALDRGPLGAPSELYGFSNDARGRFGPPSWSAARFVHRDDPTRISVAVR